MCVICVLIRHTLCVTFMKIQLFGQEYSLQLYVKISEKNASNCITLSHIWYADIQNLYIYWTHNLEMFGKAISLKKNPFTVLFCMIVRQGFQLPINGNEKQT